MSFNEKVWDLCKEIPRGRVSTYKILAEKLGTKAYRAVGNALNKNPYSPIVPCHNIVDSQGHLHGFANGLKVKRILLENEGIKIKNCKIVDFENVIYRFK
ncbi:MGMT family protein [Candidatus Woesearchaeota archaeon]|nr:MGMT family protein [Candidatus Woesearchaeota archaeon]